MPLELKLVESLHKKEGPYSSLVRSCVAQEESTLIMIRVLCYCAESGALYPLLDG